MNMNLFAPKETSVTNVQFPEVSSVYLGKDVCGFRNIGTSYHYYGDWYASTSEMGKPCCQALQYLKLVTNQSVCPFTRRLMSVNGYSIATISSPITSEDALRAIVYDQQTSTEQLAELSGVDEKMSIPPITTVVAFTHKKAYRRSFFNLLEKVRVLHRTGLIYRRLAIAIAHPLHPLGGNANGTGAHDESEKPLFVSPIPLIMMRYMHSMDAKFMKTTEEKLAFSYAFDVKEVQFPLKK